MIAALKFLHIAALATWCATLIALPLLLHSHRRTRGQAEFTEVRLLSHGAYTLLATPAAVVAIGAGTGLIFAAEVYQPWLLVKLAFVAGMALTHAWIGHLIGQMGEKGPSWRMPSPLVALLLGVPMMLAVLWLVLVKPDVHLPIPDWLLQPQEVEL